MRTDGVVGLLLVAELRMSDERRVRDRRTVTKPKPRERPVCGSFMTMTSTIVPARQTRLGGSETNRSG